MHGAVVHTLRMRVIRGDYPPGALIEPDGLDDELGVSKTVIREAMRVLSAKGLVDSGRSAALSSGSALPGTCWIPT